MQNKRPAKVQRLLFRKKLDFRILLILLAVALIVLGVLLGENKKTQTKAHYICFECIGIR